MLLLKTFKSYSRDQKLGAVFFILAAVTWILSIIQQLETRFFFSKANLTEGKIIRFDIRYEGPRLVGRRRYNYYPVVEYKTESGKRHVFISDVHGGQYTWSIGDKLEIGYLREKPQVARVNKAVLLFAPNFISIIFFIVGLLCFNSKTNSKKPL